MVLIHSTPFEAKWDGSEIVILESGTTNTLTAEIIDNEIVFTMYHNTTSIYDFTAPVESADDIYISFLIDETNEVAKPSFIYVDDDEYSYNQEEPTDEEMSDIYLWATDGFT